MAGDAGAVTIVERYSGVGSFVLGGYLAGLLVARSNGAASVTLRAPITVGARVTFDHGELDRLLNEAGDVVADASRLPALDLAPPQVALDEAAEAERGYLGLAGHLFPRCFCCGTGRDPSDGLRIFTGPVHDHAMVAAIWTPLAVFAGGRDGEVRPEIVCSALDCPAIWALVTATEPDSDEKAVSGRLEIQMLAPVLVGRPHVVVGWPLGSDGRKRYSASAIEAPNGSVLAVARQTMIVTANGVPLGSGRWSVPAP